MALTFELQPAAPASAPTDCLVVGLFADKTLSPAAQAVDAASGGRLAALAERGEESKKRFVSCASRPWTTNRARAASGWGEAEPGTTPAAWDALLPCAAATLVPEPLEPSGAVVVGRSCRSPVRCWSMVGWCQRIRTMTAR